jgi:putative FmdB family regulatory protein
MPMYEWKCEECKVYWEDLYNKPEDAPKKRRCPECNKMSPKAVSVFNARFVGSGFYCNDYGKNTWAHKSAQGAVDEFVKGAAKSSEKRMETGFQNYKVFTPDYDVLEKRGEIKKASGSVDEVIDRKAKGYRAIATEAYKQSGIDPKKQKKTNVDIMTVPDKKGLE